ncbi:MAG: TrmH family RNA methyltransferase [Solirubrobacteraceae bacterium]
MTITSPHNEKLKEIRRLTQRRRERDRAGRFVAEGEDLLAAADAAGWEPLQRLCVAGSGLAGEEVQPAVLASVSGLGSGTRTLAVYAARWAPAATGPLCVCLYGVSDPGNVGAVLRCARAFGAASVALGPGTADPYSPKAVRASMGAVFEVPLARVPTVADLPGPTVALSADATPMLSDLALEGVTFVVGAERDGLPADVLQAADQVARIPIQTHSLNAAMAATIALYEATRMARS